MNHCKTNQYAVNQGNQTGGDAIPKPPKALKYTIKNQSVSTNNLYVGINEQPNASNLLQPGEAMTVEVVGFYVIDDIYLGWDPTGTGGAALVLIQIDLGREVCD